MAEPPLRVRVPVPLTVRPPVPLTTPLNPMLPAPVSVRRKPPLVNAPLKVSVPASDPIVAAEPSVIALLMLLVPLMLRSAPSLETPLPLSVNASAPTAMLPCICKAAPLLTVVPAAVVPSPVAFWIFKTPALIVVAPV